MKKGSILSVLFSIMLIFLYFLLFVIRSGDASVILPFEENILGDREYLYLVYDIVDGDTIKIEYNNEIESVRLIGINTPEVGQCYFEESKNYLESILDSQFVKVAFDPTQGQRDKYDRLLLYVWKDGLFVNQDLIEKGYACEYTYNLPYQYVYEFNNAEKDAISSMSGLWGKCK